MSILRRASIVEAVKHAFIWLVLVFSLFPLYVTFAISVKNNKQFNLDPFSPLPVAGIMETLEREPASVDAYDPKSIVAAQEALDAGLAEGDEGWPQVRRSTGATWHWENWEVAWDTVGGYIYNTVFVGVCAVFFALVCSLSAAFFLARYRMPGASFLWYFFLILMLLPGVANLVPLFMLLRDLSLLNSLVALILVGISGAQVVQIFILRNFIEEIPKDMFDAAEVDGASPFRQVLEIVLPMSGAIISTLAILQFISVWNDFVLPFVIIRDDSLLTLAAGLIKLDAEYVKRWGEMMAGYSIASLPLVLIFLFTMRLFVRGISAGAIKG
ncbi:MAG: carbohydrate ABC transporter permease [Gemmatimonadetes bacterium]|jgi:multiple sugar transport system permease protein|nr:carbohydrate ABC transporter permease [Gemmatimonadota bacterium]MBT7862477.1 carbohydrate ABC transporter permease [Gemmatimonadota bacterium]